jgi:outer membrane protein OmpA-like peptidoglycan-associated protein
MKNIKKYNEFVETNEGIKDVVAGAGLLASTLLPNKATAGTEPGDTLHKVMKSKSEMEKLVKYNHWTLDSTTIDTKWDTIVKSAGGTKVLVLEMKISDDQYFKSGSFTLDESIKSKIDSLLNEVKSNNYQITDIGIESSTDKQPVGPTVKKKLELVGYKGDNSGLAEARAETISKYLDNSGVDTSLISINALPEQDLGGSDESGREAGARYVTVRIAVLSFENEYLSVVTEIIPKIKKTYYLSKPIEDGGKTYHPSIFKNIKKKDMGYIKNNTRRMVKDCVLPGSMVKYNKRTGLYSNY